MSKNHGILKGSPKLEFTSNFKVFMWSCREKIGRQNCYLGFSKLCLKKSKAKKNENLTFVFVFKTLKTNVQYVLGHYIVHGHTQLQADIIFSSHLTALKRCWPPDRSMVLTYSDLAFGITKSSTSVSALESLSCEWILILNKVLGRYLFKCIWYFSI